MFTVTVDTREFTRVLDEYMKFQKRSVADVINAKLYYIARNGTMTTRAANAGQIESELRAPARDYPHLPLAAILTNIALKKRGERGLSGAAMAKGIEKFIARRKRSTNFVRAGWKNAIVLLEKYLKTTGELGFVRKWGSSSPADKGTMKKRGAEKLGSAVPANIARTGRVYGEIENRVSSMDGSGVATLELEKNIGLQKAVDKEVASMRVYLERKYNPVHKEFNKKQGF